MIIVFTGNGKGKTTASLGQMVRVVGRGKSALMIQFIKGPWDLGRGRILKKIPFPSAIFDIRKMGLGFVGILAINFHLKRIKQRRGKHWTCSWRKKNRAHGT